MTRLCPILALWRPLGESWSRANPSGTFVGPAEIGLANGAWEWGNGLWAEELAGVFEFVDLYLAAGGTARLSELDLRQLVRSRLRREIRYSRLHNPDPDYEGRQLLVYERLEPRAP